MRGGGAPTGATAIAPRHAGRCCHRLTPSGTGVARRRATNDPLARTTRFGRARLSALRCGSGQFYREAWVPPRGFTTPGHVSCDLVAAGYELARRFLSQSSSSTLRTGRSTGRRDARSRPGAACETARGHRPHPAIRIASGCVPSWVRNFIGIIYLTTEPTNACVVRACDE
jgi:hypothetical protein